MTVRDGLRIFLWLGLCWVPACGSGNGFAPGAPEPKRIDPPSSDAGATPPTPSADAGGAPDCTKEGTKGCPCDTAGVTVSCGEVFRLSGAYVACSPAFATCSSEHVWGACIGDQIAPKAL